MLCRAAARTPVRGAVREGAPVHGQGRIRPVRGVAWLPSGCAHGRSEGPMPHLLPRSATSTVFGSTRRREDQSFARGLSHASPVPRYQAMICSWPYPASDCGRMSLPRCMRTRYRRCRRCVVDGYVRGRGSLRRPTSSLVTGSCCELFLFGELAVDPVALGGQESLKLSVRSTSGRSSCRLPSRSMVSLARRLVPPVKTGTSMPSSRSVIAPVRHHRLLDAISDWFARASSMSLSATGPVPRTGTGRGRRVYG